MDLSVVILPAAPWREAKVAWIKAEAYGLSCAYTYDHLSWRNFRERPWFGSLPTLTAAAAVTTSIGLGPLVTTPNFRHPLLLAKDLRAIDDVAEGRLRVGIGAGGIGYDATVLGEEVLAPRRRSDRFIEFARLLDQLLREPIGEANGEFYTVVDSRQLPPPAQLPRAPLLVSGLGPRAIDLAAELGEGWVTIGPGLDAPDRSTEEAVASQRHRLDEALERRGRVRQSIRAILLDGQVDERPLASYEAFIDWAGRFRRAGIDELVLHWPVADSQFDVDAALFERVVTEGRAHIAAW